MPEHSLVLLLAQGLMEAEKEQRKRKRAEAKGGKSFAAEDEDVKPKLEDLDGGDFYGGSENGDSGLGNRR